MITFNINVPSTYLDFPQPRSFTRCLFPLFDTSSIFNHKMEDYNLNLISKAVKVIKNEKLPPSFSYNSEANFLHKLIPYEM